MANPLEVRRAPLARIPRKGGWVDSVYHQEAYILQHRDIEARSPETATWSVVKGRGSIDARRRRRRRRRRCWLERRRPTSSTSNRCSRQTLAGVVLEISAPSLSKLIERYLWPGRNVRRYLAGASD